MMSNIIKFMVSADWHIGATDPYRFKTELINTVTKVINRKKGLDLFVVAGDTFDMKEYLSSDSVKVFLLIMIELLEITKKYKTEFRFIEGTRTHDALQLSTLSIIFNQLMRIERVKFIEEVTVEELFDTKILYIPEEYVIDDELYYKEYFSSHYDFIFGHGNTDLMWYMKKGKKVGGSSAPVFKVDDICKIANYSYFGHFHYNIEAGPEKRFKSIGPVSRWEFGKDGKCGLYYVEYDKKSNLAMEEYIDNSYAPILPTTILNIKQDYDLKTLNKKIIDKINSVDESADKIRLIVNIDTSLDSFIMMRDFILASYGNKDNLNLLLKLISSEEVEKTDSDITEVVNSVEEKPYLYDKSMHDEAKIAAFIKKKEGINISLENILNVIRKEDNKIN